MVIIWQWFSLMQKLLQLPFTHPGDELRAEMQASLSQKKEQSENTKEHDSQYDMYFCSVAWTFVQTVFLNAKTSYVFSAGCGVECKKGTSCAYHLSFKKGCSDHI